jgi:hypothetical protein
MVNEARGQLIKAAKKLVEAEEEQVDFSLLNQAITANRATYNAGQANWTAASWAEFKTAFESAVAVAGNAASTQEQVNAARQTLLTKASQLAVQPSEEGGIEFEEIDGVLPLLIEESEDSGNSFMVGLNGDYLDCLEDFVVVSGGYTYEFLESEYEWFSTGAVLVIYDENEDEVARYTLVLFGDVNGDGELTPDDTMDLISINKKHYVGDWQYCDCTDEYAESFAADVCHDGEINVDDTVQLIAHTRKSEVINQSWTCYDDGDVI